MRYNFIYALIAVWLLPALMSLSAICLLWSTLRLFEPSAQLPNAVSLSAFLGVLGIYVLNAVTERSPEDKINKPARTLPSPAFRMRSKYAAFVLLSLSGVLFLPLIKNILDFLIAFTMFIFAIGYLDRAPFRWAKSVPYLKSFWVALAWTFSACIMVPHFSRAAAGFQSFTATTFAVTFYIFAWLLQDTLLLDWNDRHGDRAHGIRTITQIGDDQRALRWILRLPVITSIAFLIMSYFLRAQSPTFIPVLVTLGFTYSLWTYAGKHWASQTEAKFNLYSNGFKFSLAAMSWRFILAASLFLFSF